MKRFRTKCPHCKENGILLRSRILGKRAGIICERCGTRFQRSRAWEIVVIVLALLILLPCAILIFLFALSIGLAAALALSFFALLLPFVMCFALVPLRENSEDAGIAASSLIWALLPATFVIFFAIQQIEIAVAAIGVMVCLVIGYFTLEPFGNTGEKD